MPGLKHSAEERARLEAIAIEMRKRGEDMQSVVEATGVSIATLYRWAREHRWRAEDMPHARNGGGPLTERSTGPTQPNDMAQQPGAAPVMPPDSDTSPVGDLPPPDPLSAAQLAMQMTARALVANNLADAERAARLSQRLIHIATQVSATGEAASGDTSLPPDPVLPAGMGAEEALETLPMDQLPAALKRCKVARNLLLNGRLYQTAYAPICAHDLFPPTWTELLAQRVEWEWWRQGGPQDFDRIYNEVLAAAESPEDYEKRQRSVIYQPDLLDKRLDWDKVLPDYSYKAQQADMDLEG